MRLPSPDLVRRALSGHAAIGLLAGGLLYLICLSGTIVVLREEIQRWEQPDIAETMTIAPQALQRAAENVLATEAGKKPTEHFYIHMPNDALPRTVVTTDHQAVYVDGAGNIAGKEAHGWTEFLINLHIYLHIPGTLGLTIVGALGVMMTALILGGVLAHPRIFRDAFRLRARGQKQLALADWHNRLGVWTLPFGLALALTGAMIGLGGVAAYAIAGKWYGGDLEAAYAPIFGGEPAHDDRPAPLANIAAATAHMRSAHPDLAPTYVILHEPGTRGQYLTIIAKHPRRLIYGDTYTFDADGQPTGKVGMSDGNLGRQFAASTYDLHFGAFGGLPVRLVFVLLGVAVTVVCGTGMSIWLVKRRQRGRASPRLESMWAVTIWGAPVLFFAALIQRTLFGAEAPMVALFWIGLAVMTAAAMLTPRAEAWSRALRLMLGTLMVGTGIVHAATMESGIAALMVIDLALIAGGAAFIAPALRRLSARPRGEPEMAPAE
ncbi:PepSY-associated TM helix domain-containing protein [Sphingomonas sp.]|uniref:PepSY-associated TM helix domain-containing protein n=1 Tax=Sphingomonas sp. TaxID=28214 RepID=UPI002C80D73C|nr:PepSY-associated TM helix domain-containing protein [Sphingomonas sp.]HTG39052.1 PepSY-associated TM helix domain-containing protein [Sphingomonas sp.]